MMFRLSFTPRHEIHFCVIIVCMTCTYESIISENAPNVYCLPTFRCLDAKYVFIFVLIGGTTDGNIDHRAVKIS